MLTTAVFRCSRQNLGLFAPAFHEHMHNLGFLSEAPPAWGEGDNILKTMTTEGAAQGPGLLVRKCLMKISLRQKRLRDEDRDVLRRSAGHPDDHFYLEVLREEISLTRGTMQSAKNVLHEVLTNHETFCTRQGDQRE
jgi:hypothetical protein